MKRLSMLLLLSLFCINIYSDNFMQEKRIYLVDVTASMEGKGAVKTPNIFSDVKQKLSNAIGAIEDPNTEVVVIPFTSSVHEPITDTIKNKNELMTKIQNLSIKPGDTNITDAWERGVEELDSTRVNYVFLLTDGLHNYGSSKEELYNRLRSWKEKSDNRYYFAFYVMLTPNAKEQEICQIVDETNQMWLIESMDVNINFVRTYLESQVNIKEKKTVKLPFKVSNKAMSKDLSFDMILEENPYYKVSNFRPHLDSGYVLFDIVEQKPLIDLPIQVWLKFYIKYDREKNYMTFFTPEVINFKVINRGIREMKIIAR